MALPTASVDGTDSISLMLLRFMGFSKALCLAAIIPPEHDDLIEENLISKDGEVSVLYSLTVLLKWTYEDLPQYRKRELGKGQKKVANYGIAIIFFLLTSLVFLGERSRKE